MDIILFKEPDECNVKAPFPLDPSFPLLWNDYSRQCRCNEYLSGVSMYTAGWNGTWTSDNGDETNM